MIDTIDINTIVASFKRDVRAKEVVNLDKNILPYEKNEEWKHD